MNGRISWRNGFQTDDAKIDISWGQSEEDKLSLNIKDAIGRKTPLTSGQIASIHGVAANEEPEVLATKLNDLARAIADALSGDRTPLNVKVVWRGKMEPGQEVFPSQEYVRGEKTDDNHKKILAKIPVNGVDQASIHSQKIAAAVAHIDDWHDHKDEYGVIMVHPYGAIYGLNTGLRMQESFYEKRQDYDRLVQNWEDLLFVMANLVRGGVLGKKVD